MLHLETQKEEKSPDLVSVWSCFESQWAGPASTSVKVMCLDSVSHTRHSQDWGVPSVSGPRARLWPSNFIISLNLIIVTFINVMNSTLLSLES